MPFTVCGEQCSGCEFFNYDEIWYEGDDEEVQMFHCTAGNQNHINWAQPPCELYQSKGEHMDYEKIVDETKEAFFKDPNPYFDVANGIIDPMVKRIRTMEYKGFTLPEKYPEPIKWSESFKMAYEWARTMAHESEIRPILCECRRLMS